MCLPYTSIYLCRKTQEGYAGRGFGRGVGGRGLAGRGFGKYLRIVVYISLAQCSYQNFEILFVCLFHGRSTFQCVFGFCALLLSCFIKCTTTTMRSFHLCSHPLKYSIFLCISWFSEMIIIDSYYFQGLGFTTIKMCTLKSCSIIFNNILMDWLIQN